MVEAMAAVSRTATEADHARLPQATLADAGGELVLRLAGDWVIERGPPGLGEVRARLRAAQPGAAVRVEAAALGEWDSLLPSSLLQLADLARAQGLAWDAGDLPEGALRLIRLAEAVPENPQRTEAGRGGLLATLGARAVAFVEAAADMASFIGEVVLALGRLLRGKALMRRRDFLMAVQQAGVDALPIITLISVLVGMIQAFVGGSQLALFGAQVFVANLVAIGMLREMGPMMASLIMAGRTGAAYAAELGTMQVNEEIDALRTMGISPMDFLILPRLLAFTLMMPLLAVYANLAGILGGALIGIGVLGITPTTYYEQSLQFVRLQDVWIGLLKAVIFGLLVAAAGCMRGIRSGRNAAAVGSATTSAVVTGIVAVIVADSIINMVAYALGL
jgi:phospholipid/cholesterol/gamma-HCH transport system permease protein